MKRRTTWNSLTYVTLVKNVTYGAAGQMLTMNIVANIPVVAARK